MPRQPVASGRGAVPPNSPVVGDATGCCVDARNDPIALWRAQWCVPYPFNATVVSDAGGDNKSSEGVWVTLSPSESTATVDGPIRVVIVDDTPDVRLLLRLQLEVQPGIEVVGEADNGLDAVRVASLARPDVLVLDMMMPGLTGIEALPRIRQVAPETRVIMFSSRIASNVEAAALRAGAAAYIEKTAPISSVIDAVRSVATT